MSLERLGAIALVEGDLGDAESRYRQALEIFRSLGERSLEATAWHQLGNVYSQAKRFEQAEHAFRESARIEQDIGNRVGAAVSWGALADVIDKSGRPDDAEAWYIKALTARQSEGDRAGESWARHALALLLIRRPDRLAEAKAYAEEALAIQETLDPAAVEIWKAYAVLAEICDKQGDADAARAYRLKERASYAAAPVSQHQLRGMRRVIAAVVLAAVDPTARAVVEPVLATERWPSLVGALRRILDGERDADALCASLDREESMIVTAVLRGIADPATLAEIFPAEPDSDQGD